MSSFAISQFIILLGPRWVSAEFLCLSTGPLLYIIDKKELAALHGVADIAFGGMLYLLHFCALRRTVPHSYYLPTLSQPIQIGLFAHNGTEQYKIISHVIAGQLSRRTVAVCVLQPLI